MLAAAGDDVDRAGEIRDLHGVRRAGLETVAAVGPAYEEHAERVSRHPPDGAVVLADGLGADASSSRVAWMVSSCFVTAGLPMFSSTVQPAASSAAKATIILDAFIISVLPILFTCVLVFSVGNAYQKCQFLRNDLKIRGLVMDSG